MTNPNGLPPFDALHDQAIQDHHRRTREGQDAVYDRMMTDAEQAQERRRASQDLHAVYDSLQGYVDYASEHLQDHSPDHLMPIRETVYGPNGGFRRTARDELDLHQLIANKKSGVEERVLLAPSAGRLVTEHTLVPSTLQAQTAGMSVEARQHRNDRGPLHYEQIPMLLEAGKIFESPAEHALVIGRALAKLVVASELPEVPAVPMPPKAKPAPNPNEKWYASHHYRHWLSR